MSIVVKNAAGYESTSPLQKGKGVHKTHITLPMDGYRRNPTQSHKRVINSPGCYSTSIVLIGVSFTHTGTVEWYI